MMTLRTGTLGALSASCSSLLVFLPSFLPPVRLSIRPLRLAMARAPGFTRAAHTTLGDQRPTPSDPLSLPPTGPRCTLQKQ
ncbi:hypothetical protein L227DRAFT_577746 [Lentinus tigrinus ALCF2SS1-6]|uniref:Uncharacterized protein n=1 Tax=Lentinus tigrinus ALCF2SS1-6 TaxID=1328759 RepID=A0A5C2S2U4_9APHY|nr:hypothetical protein L227DRAFT_577746 [Lentinus tigrinus ALCF2SS1-6]